MTECNRNQSKNSTTWYIPVGPVGTWEEKRWNDEDISKPRSNLYGKCTGFLVVIAFPPKKKKNHRLLICKALK
jgi:hypothetical protein